ncbi:MAG: WYL domain-containing protein, partial [Actinomycetota bacterium]
GPGGGFELLDTFEQEVPPLPAGMGTGQGRLRRVRVRLSPGALQLALLTGKPEAWRPRPSAEPAPEPERREWLEGSFRFDSWDGAVRELLAIGPEVEVLRPVELRQTMAEVGRRLVGLHQTDGAIETG